MPSEKTDAIVLRVIEFSETSLVVTMITRDLGRISALAKGARRPKSPFESALDLLSACRIVCLHKNTETLDILTEAKLQRRFRSAERDLKRLYAGYYVAELLLALTEDADPNQALFDLTDETLAALDAGENVSSLVLRFELAALRFLGHLPALRDCVDCGKNTSETVRVAFGLLSGGVLCAECRRGKGNIISVSATVMEQIRIFADPDETKWRNGNVAMCENGELRQVVNQYIAHQIGHRPRMRGYLEILGKR